MDGRGQAADAQLAGGSGEGSGQGLSRAGSREETKSNARSVILLANKPVHISQFPAERSCYGASPVGPLKEPMSSAFRLTLRRRMLAMGCMPSWDSRRVNVVETVINGELVEDYLAMLREASSTSE
jgi:hypothetical protein